MNVRNFSLVLAIVAMSVSSVSAQDFFWSLADLNGGATQGDLAGELEVGSTASLFLYYNTANSELNTGAFLDLTTSNAGVINITGLETFDFDIAVGTPDGPDVNDRWGDSFGAGDVGADGQSGSFNAFTVVGGTGIVNDNAGPVFFDTGYDAAADAFLFGRVDIEVVGLGTTDILITPGDGGIVHDGGTVAATFGGGTITGVAVPEPTTASLLAIGLVGLVARRRR